MSKLNCLNIFRSENCLFIAFKITRYGPTDGPTIRRTDTPSYTDGWTHLKTGYQPNNGQTDQIICTAFWIHHYADHFKIFLLNIVKVLEITEHPEETRRGYCKWGIFPLGSRTHDQRLFGAYLKISMSQPMIWSFWSVCLPVCLSVSLSLSRAHHSTGDSVANRSISLTSVDSFSMASSGGSKSIENGAGDRSGMKWCVYNSRVTSSPSSSSSSSSSSTTTSHSSSLPSVIVDAVAYGNVSVVETNVSLLLTPLISVEIHAGLLF